MANLDETNDAGGSRSPDDPTPVEKMSRLALEARVREVERANAGLKLDLEAMNLVLQRELRLSHAINVSGIPVDRREQDELMATSKSLRELLG